MMRETETTTRLTPDRRLESIQEWSDVMNTAGSWNIRSIVGRVLVAALVLTSMIGAVGVLPAQSDDHRQRYERHDRDRYEHRGRGYDRGHDRGRHNQGRRYYRAPVYRERVYVEPQVVYAPPPPAGLSIFLPPLHIGN